MKAVVFEEAGRVAVADLPDPEIVEPDDAVVRITASAICGTDLHFYHGKAPLVPGDQIGHEGAGVVELVGPAVTRVRPGDRVVVAFQNVCGDCWYCRAGQSSLCEEWRNLGAGPFGGSLGGTQAERLRVPHANANLLPIPDDVDDERALFTGDILTTGYYAAGIAGIGPEDTVAVVGAGPVGHFCVQAACRHRPRRVIAIDFDRHRLELAASVGATPVNARERNPQMAVSEMTEGRGADVVIEAVGDPSAFRTAVEVVRSGGRVIVAGMFVSEVEQIPLGFYWARMLTIRFAGICPVQAWWEPAMEAVRAGEIDPRPIISHRLPLEQAPLGYELFARREATKVVLLPAGEA